MDDLTGFQRDCLYVIAGRNQPNGSEIKRELDEYYGDEVDHGRLYPALDDLAEMGLIEKEPVDGRTNAYWLTDRGIRELRARRDWEDRLVAIESL